MVRPPVTRFTVSLSSELLDQLDDMIVRRRLPSRSRVISSLIQQGLLEEANQLGTQIVAGTITLVYGNRREPIRHQLARIQSRYLKEVISSQHVFLEDSHSLEVLLVQGPGKRLKGLADELSGVKGVKQVKVALTATVLPPLH